MIRLRNLTSLIQNSMVPRRGTTSPQSGLHINPASVTTRLLLSLILLSLPIAHAKDNVEPTGELTTLDGRLFKGIIQLVEGAFLITDTNDQPFSLSPTNLASFRLAAPPKPPAPPHGLRGTYFPEREFKGTALQQIDDIVDFDWGVGEPFPPLGENSFSVRWEGFVDPPISGTYTFHTESDDGSRLWVNGTNLVDRWQPQPVTEGRGDIELQKGERVSIKMEYYEATGEAVARLFWTVPAAKPKRTIIPNKHLYPGDPPSGSQSISSSTNELNGLLGLYFNNTGLQGKFISVTNRQLNLQWEDRSPIPDINADRFSVRWSGLLTPELTAPYTFHVTVDDGVRLWINHELVLDRWEDGVFRANTEPIELNAGNAYPIRVEMFEARGNAMMFLSWSHPGMKRVLIPAKAFHPDAHPGESGAMPSMTHGLALRNGSFLVRRIRDYDDGNLKLNGDASTPPLPLFQLSHIYFRSLPNSLARHLEPDRFGALLRNGDFIDGTFKGIKKGRILIHSVVFGLRRLSRDQVIVVALHNPAPSHKQFEIVTRDGSRFKVNNLTLNHGKLLLSDSGFNGWTLPLKDLVAIRRNP